jgi:hypothetical protein
MRILAIVSLIITLAMPMASAQTYNANVELIKLLKVYKQIQQADIAKVRYGSHWFSITFLKYHAIPFIATHTPKGTAKDWIMLWCYKSRSGKITYIQFKDGSLKPAYEVLLNYLNDIKE